MPPAVAKKVFVKTYGCQMNVYDSQRMTDALAADGYVATDAIDDADLVLLNTCHIREKAAEKVYSELGRIRDMKAERARGRARNADRRRRLRGAGRGRRRSSAARRPSIWSSARRPITGCPTCWQGCAAAKRSSRPTTPSRTSSSICRQPKRAEIIKRGVTAFLTVQEGCDKFCTFCVVPYTRGSEVSRPVAQIVAEAERLAEAGVREVTLLGQNVNAWHGRGENGEEWGLGRLLFRLAEIPGLARLRYTTSHPRDMDDELIAAHRDLPALMPYLHLPVQSGSRPHPEGDEPQAHGQGLSDAGRAYPRRAQRHRAVRRLHRRLSRRDRSRFRGDDATGPRRSTTPRPSRSNIRRAPARRAPR